MGETPNYQTLQVRTEGPVYWLNLDRQERLNALNATMVGELNDYLERLMTDASIRMMVMRGGGRAFFSGIDIKDIHAGRGLVRHHRRGAGCYRKIV
jgi:enoyl-CoA hydratase/carnithine racemase